MLSLAQNILWPYIHRHILAKASECKACTDIGENSKPIISHSKFSQPANCCPKQKTTKITPFEAHFGRKCDIAASKIATPTKQ